MSSKNCPETPRQKMIGMMYLVLTAMLALNVSADVLDAFTKVQQGLTSTIANFSKKNAEVYNDIEMAYSLNQSKVGTTREKTTAVKEKTEKMISFIETLKFDVVALVDGKETADINHIRGKDNLDAGGQILIQQGKGKELRNMLEDYREFVLSMINEKDSVLRNGVANNLNTTAPKPVDGEFKSWESANFEGIPLAGIVTLLSLMQASILTVESDVVHYLYASIDAESFKFNKLEALVIPDSRYILRGETFKAKILLAAVDTTQMPEILVNGRKVEYKGDFGVYSEAATTLGVRKLKGVINYVSPAGITLPRTFEVDYEVADPAVVISPTKMNVFYLGVDNPVSLAAPGLPPDAIVAEITNGQLVKSDGGYIVRPQVAGKKCEITVYASIDGQKRKLQTQEFRVKEVPNPVAKIAGFTDGTIKKNVLLAAGNIDVEMEGFDFDMKFTIDGYNMYTVVDGFVQEADTKGATFSQEQVKLIKNLKRNQVLVIEQIMVYGPDAKKRKLSTLSFKID